MSLVHALSLTSSFIILLDFVKLALVYSSCWFYQMSIGCCCAAAPKKLLFVLPTWP